MFLLFIYTGQQKVRSITLRVCLSVCVSVWVCTLPVLWAKETIEVRSVSAQRAVWNHKVIPDKHVLHSSICILQTKPFWNFWDNCFENRVIGLSRTPDVITLHLARWLRCGTVAQVLALPPHSKKVMGSIPTWGAVGSGGQVLPRVHSAQWAISRAFLCGVCMFSPCSQGGSSTKNPSRKTCRRIELSVPDQDESLDLVPGRLKAAHCSWKDHPGWEKCRD